MGRASVCLRCGEVGHQRATCPQRDQPRSYAAATRGDSTKWTTVSRKQDKQQPKSTRTEQRDEPLSGESEVAGNMGPPQDRRGRGQDTENMVPPQDKRGSGVVVEEEEDMVATETERENREQRSNDRKRPRETEDTNAKKVKEVADEDHLDLEEVKPILSLVLHPPGREEIIEVDQ